MLDAYGLRRAVLCGPRTPPSSVDTNMIAAGTVVEFDFTFWHIAAVASFLDSVSFLNYDRSSFSLIY